MCHFRSILDLYSLTRSLHNTWKRSLFLLTILTSEPKIRITSFNQRFPQPPEIGVLGLRRGWSKTSQKFLFIFLIVSSQPNIRNTFFDERSLKPLEEGVSRRHRHTDIHTNAQTLQLYDWIGPVGRFSEKVYELYDWFGSYKCNVLITDGWILPFGGVITQRVCYQWSSSA